MGDENPTSPSLGSNNKGTTDLLADIFGIGATTNGTSAPAAPSRGGIEDIMGLFGTNGSATGASAAASTSALPTDLFSSAASPSSTVTAPARPHTVTAYTSPTSGLKIEFTPVKDASNPNGVNITARFTAGPATSGPIQGMNFQAAVPRTMRLQIQDISTTQLLRVIVPPGAQLRLRLRLLYTYQGESRQEQADYAFPPGSY
jgi:AP-1 complex subunit gamma-1